jgi:hypothetical protein
MNVIAPGTAVEYRSATSRSIDDLDAAICRVANRINAVNYQLLLLVREFDDRFGWAKWSFRNCAEWLAWRCGISLSAAREKVRTAQALRSLPAISTAFKEGRLSYSKVRALTRAAEMHDEDLLLAYALNATAAQVEERCRQIRNVHPESVREAKRVWEGRSLSVWRNAERGTLTIHVEVPLDMGEVIIQALDRAIEAGEAATGPEFPETSWQTQQADALVAVARAYLGGATAQAASAADHYQVVVHVDESALRGGAGLSDLPIDTVKRLACDSSLIVVTEDERGAPLNVGRKHRTVPTAIRRALWSRDRGCSFPGCHNTRFVDAHHIHHWIEGGETSVENLTLLCTHHHRLLHEGGYRIRRDHEGEIYFQRTDGRVIPRCGYRFDGDDRDAADSDDLENPSAEGWLAPVVNRTKPSAEVREVRGVYRIGSRGEVMQHQASRFHAEWLSCDLASVFGVRTRVTARRSQTPI